MIVFQGGFSFPVGGGFSTTDDPVIPRINAIFAFGSGQSNSYAYNLSDQFGNMVKYQDFLTDNYGKFSTANATTFGSGQAMIAYGKDNVNGTISPGGNGTSRNIIVVTNTGIVGSLQPNVLSTGRLFGTGTGYGVDTGMFIGGSASPSNVLYRTKISNIGAPTADDVTTSGKAMTTHAAASRYGIGCAIYTTGSATRTETPPTIMPVLLFDINGTPTSETSTTSILSVRNSAGTGYGGDKAIFGYGTTDSNTIFTNACVRISNTGVPESSVQNVGTPRMKLAAATIDFDKAMFVFGDQGVSLITNKVNNQGVVSADIVQLSIANRFGPVGATIG